MKCFVTSDSFWRKPRRPSETGVALIVTLILLSVITFMAVTFLVVSRSERASVGTSTDLMAAREAANAAAERAKAEIVASMMANTNFVDNDLLVSTNFINQGGYRTGVRNYTNVSYVYPNGTPVTGDDASDNLMHLLYNPRPPVYITNRLFGSNEFRYYLDLNRNSRFEPNGLQAVQTRNGGFLDTNFNVIATPQAGVTLSNYYIGDPEWIGRLERADLPHSSSNRFIYRYAYFVVPSSKTLDLNSIHNDTAGNDPALNPNAGSHFARNMGLGTWELNLAGFLADLNTNFWPSQASTAFGAPYVYNYNFQTGLPYNDGSAFQDSLCLLRYRYGYSRRSLDSVANLFKRGYEAFRGDQLDGYTLGPVLTTNVNWQVVDRDDPVKPWVGSDNTNVYVTPYEVYDKSKTARDLVPGVLSFSDRLRMAGTNNDSYNRYTFYRMVSQLATDTASEPANKININYDNLVQTDPDTKARSATNFFHWRPIEFFTNTAQRLLANAGYSSNVLNLNHIQVYPTNFYTPSVHQMLQLAANIYDATTNRPLSTPLAPALPSVFRPIFRTEAGGNGTNVIYIAGYTEVTNAAEILVNTLPWRDLARVDDRNNLQPFDMVYGVPLVIGAKKGIPNFNELSMQTAISMSRKLEFRRPSQGQKVNETNIMYTLSVSNIVGVEAWNSYSNAYPRELQLRVKVDMFATLTNDVNRILFAFTNPPVMRSNSFLIGSGNWQGFVNPNYAQASFRIPLAPQGTNEFAFLPNSIYRQQFQSFIPFSANQPFERQFANTFPVPRWWLGLRTRMQYVLVDTTVTPNRIVDYVNVDSEEPPLDLAYIMASDGNCNQFPDPEARDGSMWCTNRWGGLTLRNPTYGMLNQISVSLGKNVELVQWNSDPKTQDRNASIDFFRSQFGLSPLYYQGLKFSETNVFYSPYVPTRTVYFTTEWQANDPIVHYTKGDLIDIFDNFQTNRIHFVNSFSTNNLGSINKRYEPWGGNPTAASASPTRMDMAVKDPMVTRSDDWDFPTNKFPSIGTLGRVHRGTPWQTINLKSPRTNIVTWQKWSGNGVLTRNVGQYQTNVVPWLYYTNDAAFTHPINDRYILDLFTTAINDNATRGKLSVNQTNLAAWSAVLSGVSVLENDRTNRFITPAGAYLPNALPPVAQVVAGIQRARTNYPGNVFHRLGDILETPELSSRSPFIKSGMTQNRDLNDQVYERIPQMVLGLLKGPDEPRFVIYAYGQALKPADRSVIPGGTYSGLCTNYQVVAEVATRTVVRVQGVPEYPPPLSPQEPLRTLKPVVESFNLLPPE